VLSRLRHFLVLVLFCLLPFHAFFVTVGTNALVGPGQPPLVVLAVWKELLIAVLFVIGILELAGEDVRRWTFQYTSILKTASPWRLALKLGSETWMITALLVLALALSTFHFQLSTFVFGFKYLFLPLVFFLLLQSLSWEAGFLERKLLPLLALIGGLLALYGILTFFLSESFFTALGYSAAHSLYSPKAPLSAFQYIAGTEIRRIQSTFAGPNQFALWLLLPWSIWLLALLRSLPRASSDSRCFARDVLLLCNFLLVGAALFLTFSRSAWVAAFVMTFISCLRLLQGSGRRIVLSTFLVVAVGATALIAFLASPVLERGLSNRAHLERVWMGVTEMFRTPLGHGLGSAGPASNRLQDPCVFYEGAPDISWAASRSDLCIFVNGVQLQPLPTERLCTCPVLTENWYVQVGIELGVLGLLLFLLLIAIVLKKLVALSYQLSADAMLPAPSLQLTAFLAFLGISIAALFLHAWEDSAVAYTVWGMVGIALSGRQASPRSPGPVM
jgi:hypothetical protein